MGSLFTYSFICCVLVTSSFSFPFNYTSEFPSENSSKRFGGLTLGGILQTTLGRQGSVFVTELLNRIVKYGTLTVKIWNKIPQEPRVILKDPKWRGFSVEVETPPLRTLDSGGEPAQILAHFDTLSKDKALWISYSISQIHRVCVHVVLKEKFKYMIYITEGNDCGLSQPIESVFRTQNIGGYNGYENHGFRSINAECAVASSGLAYVLDVYILGFSPNLLANPNQALNGNSAQASLLSGGNNQHGLANSKPNVLAPQPDKVRSRSRKKQRKRIFPLEPQANQNQMSIGSNPQGSTLWRNNPQTSRHHPQNMEMNNAQERNNQVTSSNFFGKYERQLDTGYEDLVSKNHPV